MAGQRKSYGKRSYSQDDNGGSKRRNPGDERDTYVPGPDDTVYRYLCPGRKIGSIIGRGGEIVKQLRADTQAKIRIGETVPGCEDRVVTIFSSSIETNSFDETGDNVCPAQDALFRVHERLVTEEAPAPMDDDTEEALHVNARLLVPSDQIGCIIGKGGQIIQGIRSESGAQVRIMKNEHLPACALGTDELLQISGEAAVVKKALLQVSSRLHDNPSRSQHLLTSNISQAYPQGGQYGVPNVGGPVMGVGPLLGPYGGYKGDAAGDWPSFYPPPRDESMAKEFSLRLICPADNIGGVIGKGGVIIKQIRQESGAFIKVDSSSEDNDCIIIISAKECFEDMSPVIDAAMRLQPRCSEKTERESGEASFTTRLLVPTSRIGCLIGKGGTIISDMRRTTRANIRVLSNEDVPEDASEDDEVVKISGDLEVAKNALLQVTQRLKANIFERESALSAFPPSVPYIPTDTPDFSKYGGRDGRSQSRGYSSYSGSYGGSGDLHNADSYGGYGGSQAGASGYGSYGGYSGRSGGSACCRCSSECASEAWDGERLAARGWRLLLEGDMLLK